ncbi:MAG: hypothetical protein AAF927_30975 [Bacteroidota bacterium]
MADNKLFRYPGLKPFSVKESSIFFGRGSDVTALEKSIQLDKQLVLYSKSGLGKSSLLNAGLTPRLQKKKDLLPFRVRFSAHRKGDSISLLETVKNRLWQEVGESYDMAGITAAADTLWYQFKKAQCSLQNDPTFILVFDQFEEAFTYPSRELDRFKTQLANLLNNSMPKAFLDALEAKADSIKDEDLRAFYQPLKVKAIYAIRSDKISLIDELKDVLPDILSHTYRLLALNRDQAEDAILNPAYQKGEEFASPRFDFTDEALDAILDFLTKGNEQQVESFQLQIICQFVENIVIEQGKTMIERADLGEISHIFENYYESLIGRISQKEDQLKARSFIEEGLILEADEIRLSLHEGQIERDFGISPDLLDQLEETRLIRGEPSPRGGQIYELSHDTLIKPILRAKQRRMEDEARKEEEAARAAKETARRELNERQQRRIIFYSLGAILLIFVGNFGFSWYRGLKDGERLTERLIAQQDSLRHVVDSLVEMGATPEDIQAQLQKPLPEEKLQSDPRIAELVDNLYEYHDQPQGRSFLAAKEELLTYKNDEVLIRDVIYAAQVEKRYQLNKPSTWLVVSAIEQVDPSILRQEATLVLDYLKKVYPNVGDKTKRDIDQIRARINPDAKSIRKQTPNRAPDTSSQPVSPPDTSNASAAIEPQEGAGDDSVRVEVPVEEVPDADSTASGIQ